MVTMSNIAEQFKALKPGPQRAEALTGIMRDLSNWELRYVKDVICDNQFDFDIVGNLPLELVICIFSYLDTTAPFRYQVVSKQWREVLSSEQLRASSLSKWYSNSDPPLEGEKPEYGRSNYEIQRLKLEHMQRFRLGKPSSQTVIRLPDHLDIHPQLIGTFDFFHDHVAWCLAFQTIYVMNLRTGKAFSVVGAAREQVSLILLTKDLIAFNTHSGYVNTVGPIITLTDWRSLVYAVDLNTREKRHLRLPNPSLCALSGDGRTLAAIIERHMNETHSTILVWNYDTQKSTSFVIQHKESPDVTAKMTEREKSYVIARFPSIHTELTSLLV
ncbi:hypothetical protein M501DRAFT_508304 [Patellaria atrata CBS 101060]|uniref:F-box domain-containing protein n=1 Tax=Patellaria atrata CBS 101060 TaxID=1346257 RepID=A0A9P4VKQ6_9PEZI|nr:hypothetical protein M501DRAFT_508304 [Patellaria atrata CBS 101060]